MDNKDAVKLLQGSGVLLCTDTPPGTHFGIDMTSWVVGERFMGVKMIPPTGIHFIHHSTTDTTDSASLSQSPRCGFFIYVIDNTPIKSCWQREIERLVPATTSEEDLTRIKADLPNLDRFLGAYPLEQKSLWMSLTSYISRDLLERVQPTSGLVSSAPELEGISGVMGKRGRKNKDGPSPASLHASSWEHLQPKDGTGFNFTEIPLRLFPEGSSPQEITKHSLDKSYTLERVLRGYDGDGEHGFLGEYQLAFVAFLVGQVYEGFEQWKTMTHLLCSCDTALLSRPALFTAFIDVLVAQLGQAPADFFVDIISSNNFLCATLKDLGNRISLLGSDESDRLSDKAVMRRLSESYERLRAFVEDRFGWDIRASSSTLSEEGALSKRTMKSAGQKIALVRNLPQSVEGKTKRYANRNGIDNDEDIDGMYCRNEEDYLPDIDVGSDDVEGAGTLESFLKLSATAGEETRDGEETKEELLEALDAMALSQEPDQSGTLRNQEKSSTADTDMKKYNMFYQQLLRDGLVAGDANADEDDEDAPVVVHLTEQQQRELGII